MRLRVLDLTPKNTQRRRDTCNLWVSMKDPRTGQTDPLRYGLRSFSDEFRTEFFRDNNAVVRLALRLGIDLGEKYDRFFELGMRTSQQLDGAFRERTMAEYQRCFQELRELLIVRALQRKREAGHEQLDAFLAQITQSSVSEEDSQAARQLVQRLKDKPVERPARARDWEDAVEKILKNEYEEVAENILGVADPLKSRFLAVVTFHLLNEVPDYFEAEVAGLVGFLEEIGVKNAGRYLDYLYVALEKEGKRRSFYNNNWQDIILFTKDSSPAQKEMFFKVLQRAGAAGIECLFAGLIAHKAARLLLTRTMEEAERIVNEGFGRYSNAREIDDYLERILERQTG